MKIKRINRVVRHKRNFTVIGNATLRNTELSYRALGVLCECLSHTDEWEVKRDWLVERRKEGREAISSAMQELERAGYIVFSCEKNGKGQFTVIGWFFHEQPVQQDQRTNRTRWKRDTAQLDEKAVQSASLPDGKAVGRVARRLITLEEPSKRRTIDRKTIERKVVSKETSSVVAATSPEGIFDDLLEKPIETHATEAVEEEEPKNKRGPVTREEWIKFDGITAREFPEWKKTNNKAALNGIRSFVRYHGIDKLEELYRTIKTSDYLMGRGGHTGINGKPVTPTWIFQKNHTTGEYRFDKVMANGYSNEAMAFVLEKNAPKPVSRPLEDYVTVVIDDGPERKVLKSLVSEDGKKRYLVLWKTPNALAVYDQGENWTEENWLEEREGYYRRHPERKPEEWEAQAAEVRTRLGLHVNQSVK